jgi:hypothetical protein
MAHECAPPQLTNDGVAKVPKNVMMAGEYDRMRVGATLTMEK